MTRILTIIALLFATPAWATKYLNCEGDISLSENIGKPDGKPDFRKNSRKTDVLIEMNENPLTFTTRGETYNECSVTDFYYLCLGIKGFEGWGKIRINRMNLDIMIERWIPNSKSGLNDKLLFEGSCQKAKQQL